MKDSEILRSIQISKILNFLVLFTTPLPLPYKSYLLDKKGDPAFHQFLISLYIVINVGHPN